MVLVVVGRNDGDAMIMMMIMTMAMLVNDNNNQSKGNVCLQWMYDGSRIGPCVCGGRHAL